MASPPPVGKRVAVVGAGASGLIAARALQQAGLQPLVYDAAGEVGGQWRWEPRPGPLPTAAASHEDMARATQSTAMYRSLRTNLPREVMAFAEFPFERAKFPRSFLTQREVLDYLRAFTDERGLTPCLRLGTWVDAITPTDVEGEAEGAAQDMWACGPGRRRAWRVRTWPVDSGPGDAREEVVDAVVVANGHYTMPHTPPLPGLEEFEAQHPGSVTHSRTYRDLDPFRGSRVLVIGAGASGVDISIELSAVAAKVLASTRAPDKAGPPRIGDVHVPSRVLDVVPPPTRVSAEGRVEFEDGSSHCVDAIVLATGYRYWFPFLPASLVGADAETHACPAVKPLYRQLWHAEEPTLGFLALPYKIAPFRLAELQAHAFARSLTGEAPQRLPPREERMCDARQLAAAVERGVPEHHVHVLGEAQWPYSRELAEFAGLPPPEPMVEAIYRDVGAARKRSPLRYREREYGMDVEGRQWWVTDEEGVTATLAAPGEGGARPLV